MSDSAKRRNSISNRISFLHIASRVFEFEFIADHCRSVRHLARPGPGQGFGVALARRSQDGSQDLDIRRWSAAGAGSICENWTRRHRRVRFAWCTTLASAVGFLDAQWRNCMQIGRQLVAMPAPLGWDGCTRSRGRHGRTFESLGTLLRSKVRHLCR